jgi:hypothetical protein
MSEIRVHLEVPICKTCHMSTDVLLIHFPETGHMIWYCDLCKKELITSVSLQNEPKHTDMLQVSEPEVCKTEEKV